MPYNTEWNHMPILLLFYSTDDNNTGCSQFLHREQFGLYLLWNSWVNWFTQTSSFLLASLLIHWRGKLHPLVNILWCCLWITCTRPALPIMRYRAKKRNNMETGAQENGNVLTHSSEIENCCRHTAQGPCAWSTLKNGWFTRRHGSDVRKSCEMRIKT